MPKTVKPSMGFVDDDFLVIRALWMAAKFTTRDDLRPHYIRLAEEREAIRKQALEAIR